LKARKNGSSSHRGIPISITGFFGEELGSRTANLLGQAERSSQNFDSRSEIRPGEKFTRKDP
jgi:hypothetical protein